jgi:hypothetical protein
VITFGNPSVNERLADDEFTIEKMGVKLGTRVTDHRDMTFYKYGKPESREVIGEVIPVSGARDPWPSGNFSFGPIQTHLNNANDFWSNFGCIIGVVIIADID